MIAMLLVRPRISRSGCSGRVVGALVLAGALEAVAACLGAHGLSRNATLELASAAVLHALAALPVAALARRMGSRARFGMLAVLAIPCLGVGIAAASCATHGRDASGPMRRRPHRAAPWPVAEAWRRLGRAPALGDALVGEDPELRRAALLTLSRRQDPAAIALLRRAAWGPDPELALSAGIALDEVGERAERQERESQVAERRHVAR